MSNWAPIVHSRTYQVDFRRNLLVVPQDAEFDQGQIDWALEHILGTTLTPAALSNEPRWSVFQNGKFCIVGLTCFANEVSADKIRDSSNAAILDSKVENPDGRLLYVFLGWASKEPFAPLPPMDLPLFVPLYKYVRDRWDDKRQSNQADRRPFDQPLPTAQSSAEFGLNTKSEGVQIWPDCDRAALWEMAANRKQRRQFSLCIGLSNEGDGIESPFGNITLANTNTKGWIDRPKKPAASRPIERDLDQIQAPPTEETKVEVQIKNRRSSDEELKEQGLIRKLVNLFLGDESDDSPPQKQRKKQKLSNEPEPTEQVSDVPDSRMAGFRVKGSPDESPSESEFETVEEPSLEVRPGFRRKKATSSQEDSGKPTELPNEDSEFDEQV